MMLTDKYRNALVYAFNLHSKQERKGSGVPYVAHLLGVSSLSLEYGGDENCAIGGLLHDAVEDQGGQTRLDEIRSLFGDVVAQIVLECTDSLETPRPRWKDRKTRYIEHLGQVSPDGQLVSACDKLYNARTILSDYRIMGEALWQRFTAAREGVLWYYQQLARAYSITNPVTEELARTVAELESLALEAPNRY